MMHPIPFSGYPFQGRSPRRAEHRTTLLRASVFILSRLFHTFIDTRICLKLVRMSVNILIRASLESRS